MAAYAGPARLYRRAQLSQRILALDLSLTPSRCVNSSMAVGKKSVRVRVVGGDDDGVVADGLDHLPKRLLVGVGRNVALAEKVLARQRRSGPRSQDRTSPTPRPSARATTEGTRRCPPGTRSAGRGCRSSTPPAARLPKAIINSTGLRPATPITRAVRGVEVAARQIVAQRRMSGRVEATARRAPRSWPRAGSRAGIVDVAAFGSGWGLPITATAPSSRTARRASLTAAGTLWNAS